MLRKRILTSTLIAIALAAAAVPTSATASPARAQLDGTHAFLAAAQLSPGRADELLRPLAPDAAFGSLHVAPTPQPSERLGRRAILVHALAWNTNPASGWATMPVDLLVRQRAKSGRIVVRLLLG
jgi:hypothetical protein